jgi:single-stranded DNA-binding protein
MASVNKAIILGAVGRDPEVRYLATGNIGVLLSKGGWHD